MRALPDEDIPAFVELMRQVVGDPAVEVKLGARDTRPSPGVTRLDSEAFKAIEAAVTRHYAAVTLPTMSTGATDMAYLRAKGMQCYGVGPAIDHRGRAEGIRRAQRPGTHPRGRAAPIRQVPVDGRHRSVEDDS